MYVLLLFYVITGFVETLKLGLAEVVFAIHKRCDMVGLCNATMSSVLTTLWFVAWDSRNAMCPVVITKWLSMFFAAGAAWHPRNLRVRHMHPRNLLSLVVQLPGLAWYLISCRLARALFISLIVAAPIAPETMAEWDGKYPNAMNCCVMAIGVLAWYLAAAKSWRQLQWGCLQVWNPLVHCTAVSVQLIVSACSTAWQRALALGQYVAKQRWIRNALTVLGGWCTLPLHWLAKLCIAVWLLLQQVSDWLAGMSQRIAEPLVEWRQQQQQQQQRKQSQHQRQRAAASSKSKQNKKQHRAESAAAAAAAAAGKKSPAGQSSASTAGLGVTAAGTAAVECSFWSALRAKCCAPKIHTSREDTRRPGVEGEKSCITSGGPNALLVALQRF
jgi:hypothetical protein